MHILRRQARFSVVAGALLLAVAFDPSMVGSALELVGMKSSAARLAGSRLAVMAAFTGAGLLFIGLSGWARASRIRATSERHAALLDHLGHQYGARALVVPGVGAACVADVDGLRMEIVVEPEKSGQAWVRARCSPARALQICPRGLGPAEEGAGLVSVSSGRGWEAWATSGANGPPLDGAARSLSHAFGAGGVSHILHDGGGIELAMPNAPADELFARLCVALQAVSSLARTNR